MVSIPNFTITLLSSMRGAMSPIVPTVTRSNSFFRLICRSRSPRLCMVLRRARRKKKVTPQAASSRVGNRESALFGLIRASAGGCASEISWWSMIMVSTLCLVASTTSLMSVDPQSRQTTRETP
ncbi:MAG: hypothetical protein A4E63_02195 [Syntrophorhabdus sp. PtaU1.Bin050]|nr:MAG: hypothetical protein A4E63_02195 [Syntrophorhabdus sp. PtaU1.Bin050]